MKKVLFLTLAISLACNLVFAADVQDDFSKAKMKGRAALRGAWKFENNTASCVSDPALYKKFKNHGPILRWPIEMTDGEVSFEFQPKKCDRIIITFNNKTGHVFRIALYDEKRTRIFGWDGPSKNKKNKPKVFAKDGVPKVADLDGEWIKSKITFKGNEATIKIGDYSTNINEVAAGREKGEFTISFAAGELAVRNVKIISK